MTNRLALTLKMPICYVVMDPDRADSAILSRRSKPGIDLASAQRFSAFQVRLSLAEMSPPGGCRKMCDPAGYTHLRLAIDLIRDLDRYPQLLPHFAAAQRDLLVLTLPDGPFNRMAAEL